MGTQTMAPHANSIGSCCALMKRGTLMSDNGEYRITMQGDGNLVLYNADNDPLWASGTAGEHGAHCILQGDGHFCIYALDPDGNVSKDSEDCIWRSRVCGETPRPSHAFRLGKWRQVLRVAVVNRLRRCRLRCCGAVPTPL